ncbi:tight junction protein ZO-1-like isoform X9 [Lates japonicus]|uniref:Tight junction protein ZO-1-like isoform X9 n=1 Tax=Lates japonicus TaxID=270547 RepID=A0AAD3M4G7_LATJO|nr:tight junction protein ZO-1-like isoform X9 [Lates japonicus]
MLNILLSALIDPDRRLRSFRRSERLASILSGPPLCSCNGPLRTDATRPLLTAPRAGRGSLSLPLLYAVRVMPPLPNFSSSG